MAIYRCASCGSSDIHTETRTEGISYNYKKGIIGTVVFGEVGAVAGLENKKSLVYVCNTCGNISSSPMDAELQLQIDLRLSDERQRMLPISWRGRRLYWETIRAIYKNLEKGRADEERERSVAEAHNCTKEEFDNAIDILRDYSGFFSGYKSDKQYLYLTLAEYKLWLHSVHIVIENINTFLPFPVPHSYRDFNIDTKTLEEIFVVYLESKVQQCSMEYLPIKPAEFNESPQIQRYAKLNSFICHFANTYFPIDNIIRGGLQVSYTPSNMALFVKHAISHNLSSEYYNKVKYTFKMRNGENINIYYIIPKYISDGRKVGYWFGTKSTSFIIGDKTCEELIHKYFEMYPDKKIEYSQKVSAHQKAIDDKPYIENEINKLKSDRTKREEQIQENSTLMQKLSKKIFGKAKAEREISKLQKENITFRENIKEIEKAITNKEKILANIVSDQEFYENLLEEMDYFIVWHWND